MKPNISSQPGVSTKVRSALGGGEDRARPSALANSPKKNLKNPRMDILKGAGAYIQAPRHTEEKGNVDVRTGGDLCVAMRGLAKIHRINWRCLWGLVIPFYKYQTMRVTPGDCQSDVVVRTREN
ncbi:hypothetical protein LIER_29257 [Lithospermum erythrorhizon]|uniref:Uncharacterized protein n=1 Tax=Lithospermum erythrorhizon TaxID=34254 RepID=A0AAV3RM39_LITER